MSTSIPRPHSRIWLLLAGWLASGLVGWSATIPEAQAARRHRTARIAHVRAPAARPVIRQAPASLVMDAETGRILHQDRASELRFPASLTKVMTAFVVFQEIRRGRLKLTDRVVFSRFASTREPTRFGMKPGQSMTVKDALMVALVRSCNDAAEALAERVGGSSPAFARLMTLEARRLGMKHTHFYNATGLPHPLQKTTAHDLAVLARAVIRQFPQYLAWFGVKKYSCHGRTLANTNRLLGSVPGNPSMVIDGFKTGFTRAAGCNLLTAVRSGQKRWIVVVMGQPDRQARNKTTLELVHHTLGPLRHDHDKEPAGLFRMAHQKPERPVQAEKARPRKQTPRMVQVAAFYKAEPKIRKKKSSARKISTVAGAHRRQTKPQTTRT